MARDVNSILIPKLYASGLQCKDAHMRPSLMRKILKEIGYAQKYHDGHEYYLKVFPYFFFLSYSLTHLLTLT